MKKMLAILVVMVLTVTTVFANTVPGFLTEIYTNYTADYSVSMSFESSEEVVALLKEIEMPEEIEYFVDMESLLKTLLTYDGKMNLQADISGDNYEIIKIALTAENSQNISVNPNLDIGLNYKEGMWININLTDLENPVFDIIYSAPIFNKYMVISMSEIMDAEITAAIKSVFNKQYIETLSKSLSEMFFKHAQISGSGNKYTITLDNDGFAAYAGELVPVIFSMVANSIPQEEGTAVALPEELPSFDGLQFLGEDGIKYTYTLSGGKLSKEEIVADISLDISKIYTELTGEEWMFESKGLLDFTVKASANISKIGSTSVVFPEINEENSVLLNDLQPEENPEDYYEEETEYPYWYAYGSSDIIPVINEKIYVPLRSTLECAYEDTAVIEYNQGVITVTSDYFTDFEKLTVTIGSDKVYADDTEYTLGGAVLINDTTYVDSALFCEIFGWEFESAYYDILEGSYYYSFYTEA